MGQWAAHMSGEGSNSGRKERSAASKMGEDDLNVGKATLLPGHNEVCSGLECLIRDLEVVVRVVEYLIGQWTAGRTSTTGIPRKGCGFGVDDGI